MKVVKFGGSSLADGQAFQQAIKIITGDPERWVIVTSAPGKRQSGDTKVTDLLIKYAQLTKKGQETTAIAKAIFQRYQQIGNFFGLDDNALAPIKEALEQLPAGDYPDKDYLMAAFKAHGERLNARLMAMVLNHLGYKSRFVDPSEAGIIVSGTPNNASVLPITYQNLAKLKVSDDERLVFPGFFGFTPTNHIATFSRGGSDITGAILARGLRARVYENFTDVDAIFSANPKVVDHPAPIKRMTYREMRELSYAGFSVFHDEALIPAIQGQIPVNVRNTKNPSAPGTMIVPENGFQVASTVTGVACAKHFAGLYLHKYLMNKEVGFSLQILEILRKYHLTYEHMPSGIDDITIILDRNQLTDVIVDRICNEIQEKFNPDTLRWIDDYAITMVVGEGMNHTVGAMSRIANAVAKQHMSMTMVNQGASQISIMIGTKTEDADDAVRAIYDEFFHSNPKED
ncbi:aspartate kinase [Limosilactobacillus difficilis]|uniref:aspartate kinase n=1 Tax=Limosilactobacillus difficilis TaxID=2991838 RepID=UPI0024BAE8AA|nr:aspartate kinase [Limosilactobacillus difficilis]